MKKTKRKGKGDRFNDRRMKENIDLVGASPLPVTKVFGPTRSLNKRTRRRQRAKNVSEGMGCYLRVRKEGKRARTVLDRKSAPPPSPTRKYRVKGRRTRTLVLEMKERGGKQNVECSSEGCPAGALKNTDSTSTGIEIFSSYKERKERGSTKRNSWDQDPRNAT